MAPLPLRNQSNPQIIVLSFVISFSFCIHSMNKSPRIRVLISTNECRVWSSDMLCQALSSPHPIMSLS